MEGLVGAGIEQEHRDSFRDFGHNVDLIIINCPQLILIFSGP